MKLPLENKHVERILSLIVIMYGLRLIIPNIMDAILYMQSGYVSEVTFTLSHIVAGCLLIVFFARIVQVIGYFATKGEIRSKRCWCLNEILAIPLILYAFTEFLLVFVYGVYWNTVCFYPHEFLGVWYDWSKSSAYLSWLSLYLVIATVILFNARRIAVWLLRIVER